MGTQRGRPCDSRGGDGVTGLQAGEGGQWPRPGGYEPCRYPGLRLPSPERESMSVAPSTPVWGLLS